MGKQKWNEASIRAEAQKYTQPTDFRKNSHGAFLAASRLGILDEVCGHMNARRKLTKEHVLGVARQYNTRKAFSAGAPSEYRAALHKGYLDEACAHMTRNVRWTEERVRAEALKYPTRYQFETKSSQAYQAAKWLGIYEQVCAHMKYSRRTLDKTTVASIANGYKTRKDFQNNDASAYNWAVRNKCIDQLCKHMERGFNGFNNDKPGTLYQIKLTMPNGQNLWKIGITNGTVGRRLTRMGVPAYVGAEISCTMNFANGSEARATEGKLLRLGRKRDLQYDGDPFLRNGNTELFCEPLLHLM